jgi:transposase
MTGVRRPTCWAGWVQVRSCWVTGAYDSDALRAQMAEQGAWANVRPMPNRKQVLAFSPFLYKYRNLVERFFSKIKHFRAVATRYDKDPDNFLASVKLAALRVWLRAL